MGRTLKLATALMAGWMIHAQAPAQAQAQAQPAPTQPAQSPPSARPITDTNANASDVATTPLRALNLKKKEIPPVLQRAVEDPYSLAGLGTCRALKSAVRELNTTLGDDIDVAKVKGRPFSAGNIAQSVVDSLIPFEGIISEVSGANAAKRRMQAAIYAGFARRGFLKGVGESRHCPAPARPV